MWLVTQVEDSLISGFATQPARLGQEVGGLPGAGALSDERLDQGDDAVVDLVTRVGFYHRA